LIRVMELQMIDDTSSKYLVHIPYSSKMVTCDICPHHPRLLEQSIWSHKQSISHCRWKKQQEVVNWKYIIMIDSCLIRLLFKIQ